MNRLATISALLATAAFGAQADTFFDNARVRHVEPQYETVSIPRQECTVQTVYEQRRVDNGPNYGGVVIGGVAGAVVGNQVGKGHGREAATALGAVVGAMAGDRVAGGGRYEQYEQVPRQVQSCQTVNDVQQRVTGYRVQYEWRGQNYATFLREQPGRELQVRVSVEPVVR